MNLAPPVRYTPEVEQIQPDEAETIDALNGAFDKILEIIPRIITIWLAQPLLLMISHPVSDQLDIVIESSTTS